MHVIIKGIDHLRAMPQGFMPLLDAYGDSHDGAYRRLHVPRNLYQLADGLEYSHEPDPTRPGTLGSRWYQLGAEIIEPLTSPVRIHLIYPNLLRHLLWSDPTLPLGFAQQERFWDLCALPGPADYPNQLLGPGAVQRLAADFQHTPDLTELIKHSNITITDIETGHQAPRMLIEHHRAWAHFITDLSTHKEGVAVMG